MIVGDGPQEPTGLGRILRDLATRIHTSDLPVELVTVGGCIPPVWQAGWPHYALDERLQRGEDWGTSYVDALWASHFGSRPGVLWVIWDPSRLVYYQGIQAPVVKWAYPAVDAGNGVGSLGGPAGAALASWDRVIAYGRWGSQIIRTVREGPVPYLPHGIMPQEYGYEAEDDHSWAREQLGPHCQREDLVIGCVATNQPRKDLGLFFQTLGQLKDRGWPVFGWLHTDVLVKAWSVGELIDQCGLGRRVAVSLTYTDHELAAMYQACDATIAPGLGEGFGYPIVESLANGVAVVHGDFGGGRELVPKREWRFPVREVRLEGIYALQRPVFRAEDVANAIERAVAWRNQVGPTVAAEYCRGAVAHLAWEQLWPRWYAWIKAGL